MSSNTVCITDNGAGQAFTVSTGSRVVLAHVDTVHEATIVAGAYFQHRLFSPFRSDSAVVLAMIEVGAIRPPTPDDN